MGHGQNAEKYGKPVGSFTVDANGQFVIKVVRDNENAPWVLAHEGFHLLIKLGLITKADQASINARARKDGTWDDAKTAEENQANWMADFQTGPKPPQTVLAQIWQKIKDFVASLAGMRTTEKLAEDIRSGNIHQGPPKNIGQSSKDAVYALFHGTTEGNDFTEFNLDRANWGVGSNPFAQGNKGVYLNDDIATGRYLLSQGKRVQRPDAPRRPGRNYARGDH
jgi:hypothetical protein